MKATKQKLHPRNKHKGQYDFEKLTKLMPELNDFVHINKHEIQTIDFSDADAVKTLNKALLKSYYKIKFWDIPPSYLCPPIPGRADYIHNVADLLGKKNGQVNCLDIGVGTSCIFPIIGCMEYGWNFVGCDTDKRAVSSAKGIIAANPQLKSKIKIRLQENSRKIFDGIIQDGEKFDVSICNPPFHETMKDAKKGTLRKLSNLTQQKVTKVELNFGGQYNELCYDGGEEQFIKNIIYESKQYSTAIQWFTSLVSKESKLGGLKNTLHKVKAKSVHTMPMGQGNKKTRILVWTF